MTMIKLAKGHERFTLAIITLIPLVFFYSLRFLFLLGLVIMLLASLVGHLYFFRDPDRMISKNAKIIVAPADGKIYEVDPTNGIIRIRMSLFNIHVTRAPVEGTINAISREVGKNWPFFSFLPQGTLHNTRQIIQLTNSQGEFLVIQIVGILARRSTCYWNEGDTIEQGERLGMLYYGSEVDIHYPPDLFQIQVTKSMTTQAGSTVLARLKEIKAE